MKRDYAKAFFNDKNRKIVGIVNVRVEVDKEKYYSESWSSDSDQ